jgi:ABC-type glycerol-3-phosphate transport system substrate-binding protein
MNFVSKAKKYTLLIIISGVFIFIILGMSGLLQREEIPNPTLRELDQVYLTGHFSEYLIEHSSDQIDTRVSYQIPAADFILDENENLDDGGQYYIWDNPSTVKIIFEVEVAGLYHIWFDYMSSTNQHLPISLAVYLNDEEHPPYHEASQITLNTLWRETTNVLSQDRYGNDVSVAQEPYPIWQEVLLKDARRLYIDGLSFYLDEGVNTIEFVKNTGELFLREITIRSTQTLDSYQTYLNNHSAQSMRYLKRFEAEETYYKNSSTISRGVSRDPSVRPFSMTKLRLNVLGTESFDTGGDAVSWIADIDTPGLYNITLKVKQLNPFTTVYRTLYINGEIPFEEAKHLPISYHRNWQMVTLAGLSGEPLLFYLEPGDKITLEVDASLFASIHEKMRILSSEISQLGLDVTKLTRNNTDRGIDWDIIQYFPTIHQDLERWIAEIDELSDVIQSLYGFTREAQIIRDFAAANTRLKRIQSDVNELPRRLTLLSTGSSSAVQLISNQLDGVLKQPMIMDAFYIHTEDIELPNPNPTFLRSFWVGISRFVLSFIDPSYTEKADPNELEVWVNRSRQYVDLMQKITDDQFTQQTGINVKVSLINDDSKLLLANSANQQPDVALGISAWIPNEFGMRGMLHDLSQREDFKEVISVYHPEQLIPMVYDNRLYGLPETENFYVMFYRKDILDQLDLTVPETWDDVLGMLPVLRRFGMSFYIPLSSSSAQKSFDATGPFIYQFGGQIYSEDGLSGAIDDENTIRALSFMTDLYREYSMPLQVPSFFNSFRYSDIPIGIGDFGMYLQLMNAASDISGLWEIALVPGVKHDIYNEDTQTMEEVIKRYMPGAQQAGIIFEKSQKKDDAWAFLSWWMSTETQILFSETLVNTLGTRYLWNTANMEAFEQLRWNEAHKSVIMEQWTHLKEVPKIPGSYIIEREISNTWNRVVFEDANLRSTVSDATLKINKELTRKMIEFGYVNQRGEPIREFIVPRVDDIMRWYDE